MRNNSQLHDNKMTSFPCKIGMVSIVSGNRLSEELNRSIFRVLE